MNGTFLGHYDSRDLVSGRRMQSCDQIETDPDQLELIFDESGALLPFHFLRTGDQLGRAVVKLLRDDGGAGTAFLVAPGILLTNHHVLPDEAAASAAFALANFEAAPPGSTPVRPATVRLDPDALFVSNAELDFTFCGVRGLENLGTIPLDRNSQNIAATETVNIIQHPRGRPKEVAIRDNRVVKADGVVVHYSCSTEPGSSGSPVFNNRWEPVALHHASVVAEAPEARRAGGALDDGVTRYLNEGIRVSAIAIWLETAEAEAAIGVEQAARLRAIFRGVDPLVGFFGALGRRAHGKSAPEIIAECYRAESDDLDLAFWNTRGLETTFREQIADIGNVVAAMKIDLWCLAHADGVSVAALCEHLDSHHRLDYEFLLEPAGDHPAVVLLYRRTKGLAIEWKAWGLDHSEKVGLPPLVSVKANTPRQGAVAFHLVPVVRSPQEAPLAPYAEAIRRAIRLGQGQADWIVVGDPAVLLDPERIRVLADCDRVLLAAAAERDGAVALLTGPCSKVRKVFASPNLRPAFAPESLVVPRDRELPPLLRSLGGHLPIAIRLTLDGGPRTEPPAPAPVVDPSPPLVVRPDDDELERRLRDMLSPLIARLIDELRPRPGPGA